MPDIYRFSVPIEFSFKIDGESNDNMREQLRKECEKLVQTITRAKSGETLFDYPVQVDKKPMTAQAWIGFLGTRSAPNRFRSKEVEKWSTIATELLRRSTNDYGLNKPCKKNLITKADVPFYIGRFCRSILVHLAKYQYVTYRQMELLEYWSKTHKTTAICPNQECALPLPKVKEVKPKIGGWEAIGEETKPQEIPF